MCEDGIDVLVVCLPTDPFLRGILYCIPVVLAFLTAALTGPKWRARVRGWLRSASWSKLYADLLLWVVDRIDAFLGAAKGWKCFSRLFAISMLYAFGFLIFQLLRQAGSPETKTDNMLGFLIGSVFGLLSFFAVQKVSSWRPVLFVGKPRTQRFAGHIVQQLIALALIIALSVLSLSLLRFFFEGAPSSVFILAGIFSFAGGFSAGMIFAPGLGVYVAILMGLGMFSGSIGTNNFNIFVSILLFIPLANTVFDWASWIVSRYLMQRLSEDTQLSSFTRRISLISKHIIFDLGFAILMLFALAVTISNVAAWSEVGSIWDDYAQARTDPFSGVGAAMTVMLLTTLLPTAIHIFLAILALSMVWPPRAEAMATWIEEDREGGEVGTQILVALYLTACVSFALIVAWAFGWGVIWILNGLASGAGLWPLFFFAAEKLTFF